MLPFDNRPWAKPLARTVVVLSFIGAALAAYYCYITDQLHISEIAIIGLLLLTIVPPNLAIVLRKTEADADTVDGSSNLGQQAHLRIR
jgi:hypothetical protein